MAFSPLLPVLLSSFLYQYKVSLGPALAPPTHRRRRSTVIHAADRRLRQNDPKKSGEQLARGDASSRHSRQAWRRDVRGWG
ncbi:hypothetical protein AOLI_G00251090 [Acnodon oligacanthus]